MVLVILLIALLSGGAGFAAGYYLTQDNTEADSSVAVEQEPEQDAQTTVVVTPEKIEEETPTVEEQKVITVCLDAGHGGVDGGANIPNGDGTFQRLEKEDNLKFALAIEQAMEAKGVQVVMTRSDDTKVSLDERCNIANESNADYFISLHRNSANGANGVEVWKSTMATEEGSMLADKVMAGLETVGVSRSRGVGVGSQGHDGDYKVLRDTKMCSILVEMGFIESSDDNANFDGLMEQYADAFAQAVLDTYEAYHGDEQTQTN